MYYLSNYKDAKMVQTLKDEEYFVNHNWLKHVCS